MNQSDCESEEFNWLQDQREGKPMAFGGGLIMEMLLCALFLAALAYTCVNMINMDMGKICHLPTKMKGIIIGFLSWFWISMVKLQMDMVWCGHIVKNSRSILFLCLKNPFELKKTILLKLWHPSFFSLHWSQGYAWSIYNHRTKTIFI